jgi:hypothetical protein
MPFRFVVLNRTAVTLAVLLLVRGAAAQILFDNTKAETAGNADWIIDTHQPIPSPAISGITAASAESYWTGALSSWGVALAKLRNAGQISLAGNGLETLPAAGAITYGSGANAQDLSHYQVFVVCEPNIRFTDAEKTAILSFVQNGGGLFMVADHNGSDRNGDGWDSLRIWNDLMFTNSVQSNPFGFSFNADDVTPNATADSSSADPLTHGIGGTVTTLQYSSGATMRINNATQTHAAAWGASSSTAVLALYGTYGNGKFVAIGDSSVTEDATSSSGTTYAGWTTPPDNGHCAINGTVWLLGAASTNALPPSVTTGAASGVGATNATLNGIVNAMGQTTTVWFQYGVDATYGLVASLPNAVTGSTAQAVSAAITNLSTGTNYHFRIVATNAAGLANGADETFTTSGGSSGGGGTTGATNIVISQFYGAGGNTAGVTYKNDFAELFNPNSNAVSVAGWSVQYASAAGSTWLTTSLTGSIPGYHYYLVQLGSGGSSGSALPTPDATGSPNISATSGKLALVSNQTALTGTNPSTLSQVVDFVGWGTANGYFGTGTAPGGGNTTSTLRSNGGYANTTNNATDFTTLSPPNPRNTNSPANPPATQLSDLAITISHNGTFTQADNDRVYVIAVTNIGTAATVGTVSVTDLLPAGLAATMIGGVGWTTNLATLTCTRSDALAVGAGYPTITMIVNVSSTAPATVTNVANVSGGGETNTANDTASDATPITPLTPIQSWRLRWFGTTTNSGLAADGYVASSDGLVNLLKYATGFNPLVPTTNPAVGDISTGFLRITSPRSPDATDISFHADATGDLVIGTWNSNATTVDINTATQFQAHANSPVSSGTNMNLRLRVSRP